LLKKTDPEKMKVLAAELERASDPEGRIKKTDRREAPQQRVGARPSLLDELGRRPTVVLHLVSLIREWSS